MQFDRTILITGGAGFIGSHLVRRFVNRYPSYRIVNLDKLTYAGNLKSLIDIEKAPNYHFLRADIVSLSEVQEAFDTWKPDAVIHLAAESHVDRSIHDPLSFVQTNVIGTCNLLHTARTLWKKQNRDFNDVLFYHVSTDEVYGTLNLGTDDQFQETTPYDPHSPYSASKASSDHFVRAWGSTYNFPYLISNCSNNYGPFQFPEKLIPLTITNLVNGKNIPVYGTGENVRDWLYVEDHCAAIDTIFHSGKRNRTYNIGGKNELQNIYVVKTLCKITDELLNREPGSGETLITFVTDRPGHDLRYAIDPTRLETELGWMPAWQFENAIRQTVEWYLNNQPWVQDILSGDYQKYYELQYSNRNGHG